MYQLSLPKPPISYVVMTTDEWQAYPKDGFHKLFRRWCEKHNFMQYVGLGEAIPAKLPYRKRDDGKIEVAQDFLDLVARWKKLEARWHQ